MEPKSMLDARYRALAFAAGLTSALVVAFVDVLTGYEINLGLFYLVPIALVTWWVGRVAGVALSVACVVGMFIVDIHVTREIPFPSNDLIPYWNSAIRLGYFLVFVQILTALKLAHERERLSARQDYLTGVANYQSFSELMRLELARARRSGLPLSIAYVDCDNFKEVNDRFGHSEGDYVLRETAQTMCRLLRASDVVARLGGDEFAMLFSETGAAPVRDIMQKLHSELLQMTRRRNWPVTYSIGVVTFLTPPENADSAIRESDLLMYNVKRLGKNQVAYRVLGGEAGTAAGRNSHS